MKIEKNVINLEEYKKLKERENDPSWSVCQTYINSMKGPKINPLMCVLARRKYKNEKEVSPIIRGKSMSPEYISEVEKIEKERGFI